jgi:dipeptide transport system substrate-binding protein
MNKKAAIAIICWAALWAAPAAATGSLTVCTEGAPEGFDIVQYETVATNDAAGLPLYDQLIGFKTGGSEVAPALAERWEVGADGLVYTLHLRRGVRFHQTPWFTPTREMNADDVIWSIQRIRDPAHPAYAAARNGFPYWAGMNMGSLIRSIDKVDEFTVRFTLSRPEAPFLADLALSAIGSIYSAEYGEQLLKAGQLERLNSHPVGSGPFVFKSYQKDAVIRYGANAEYWAGAPKIEQLIFAITPDPAVRLQRLKAGECAVAQILAAAAPGLASDTKLVVDLDQPLATSYLAPNSRHGVLGDARFRRALSLAIDRPAFIRSVYNGQATLAGSFLPPGIWSHDTTLRIEHDPEQAKALVKAAGYDGRELTLFATSRTSDIQRAVELLQADWARIGVKLRVQLLELGELYKRTGRGDHDIALLSWYSDNGDPDNFFTPNLSCSAVQGGGNKAQWCNPAFEDLLNRARASGDIAQRTALYRQAQRLLFDEAGVIPLAHKMGVTARASRVKGVRVTPFGGTDFRGATVD